MSGIKIIKLSKEEYLQKLETHIRSFLKTNLYSITADHYNLLQAIQDIDNMLKPKSDLHKILSNCQEIFGELRVLNKGSLPTLMEHLSKAKVLDESENSCYSCNNGEDNKLIIVPKKNEAFVTEPYIRKIWDKSRSGILPTPTVNTQVKGPPLEVKKEKHSFSLEYL